MTKRGKLVQLQIHPSQINYKQKRLAAEDRHKFKFTNKVNQIILRLWIEANMNLLMNNPSEYRQLD
jgi:hypothetical protein